MEVVRENPYRLAEDIYGIGFVKADQIAMNLGIDKESEARAKAGIMHCLHKFADEGHVFYPYEPLVEACKNLLDVPDTEGIIKAVAALIEERRLVAEDLNKRTEAFFPNHKAVYLTGYHLAEKGISQSLKILLQNPSHLRAVDPEKALEWVQERIGFTLSNKQQIAVKTAVTEKVMVLTGGPGTGKTTILKAVLQIFRGMHVSIALGAPTGRAAKKLHEATGAEAMTLHRLLEWDFRKMGFKRDAEFPLPAEVVIVDEASMIDTLLMHHFLKAVSPGAVLILVGDVNQLPSVGAGNVLNDIIASGAAPVVELDEIFRQVEGSLYHPKRPPDQPGPLSGPRPRGTRRLPGFLLHRTGNSRRHRPDDPGPGHQADPGRLQAGPHERHPGAHPHEPRPHRRQQPERSAPGSAQSVRQRDQ